jgi:hypothetical protein
MKRWRTWIIVAAAAVALAACRSSQLELGQAHYLPLSLRARTMATYYVDSTVPGPGTGTIGDPWDDIASNINTLAPGDTLYLRGGVVAQVYNEAEIDITVNDITVEPYQAELVEIRTPAGSRIFDLHSTGIVLEGKGQMDINRNGLWGAYPIEVRAGADNCIIRDCEIRNGSGLGRLLRISANNTLVHGCTIHNCFNSNNTDSAGVSIEDGTGNTVEYCTIYDIYGDGVYIHDANNPDGTIIRYNTIYTTLGRCSENGIDAKENGTTTLEIYGNTFYGFRACTATCGGSGDLNGEAISIHNDCDNVEIYENEIYNCSNAIVLDDGVSNISVHNNVIHDLVGAAADPNAQWCAALTVRAANVDIYHNTVDNCPENSFVFVTPLSNVVIENNIFNDCGSITGASLAGYSADYNLWSGCADVLSGAHDVTQPPQFTDAANDDYTLQDTSPAIDVGKDLGLSFYGSAPDMGAFEWEAEEEDEPYVPPTAIPAGGGGVAEWQIWLKDWDGRRIAVFTGTGRETGGLLRFSFLKVLRKPGQYILELDGRDGRVDYFTLDYMVEFWRRDRFGDLDWYKVFEAFHRADTYRQDESGRDIYTSSGDHYNILLLAEPIFYAAGTAYTSKSGPAETVAKEYVNENIGPSATSPPRDYDGVMPGLTIEADAGTGATWEGGRAKQNLLDVAVELAEYAPADFMVEGTGAATFEFRWRMDQWGDDKTWGNAAGIPPVVFDGRLGNARNTLYEYNRKNEINTVHVLGQGSGEDRRIVTRTSGAESDSPWSHRAVCRDARNTYSTEGLNRKGDEVLDKMRSRIQTQVDVAQTPATRFGRDWDIGDLVTVRYRGFSVAQKIIGVRVDVGQDGQELIQAIMEEA